MNTELWRILVPTEYQDTKKPVRKRHHRVWDRFVRNLSGGLTILYPAKGQWLEPKSGELIEERMIPVEIVCSEVQIRKIMDFTIKHYRQLAVLAYRISDKVILLESK